jgi:hypothetical protein
MTNDNDYDIVKEIGGIHGFCVYEDGIPFTYLNTRDIVYALGLIETKNDKVYAKLARFGSYFIDILEHPAISQLPVSYGINLTQKFKLSFNGGRPSKYDNILPEYIVDKVLFLVLSRLRNQISQELFITLTCILTPQFQKFPINDYNLNLLVKNKWYGLK